MHSLKKVQKHVEILTIARLANKIWNEHFVDIIGQKQVDYMLEKFQSEKAVEAQIKTGCEYYIIGSNDQEAGYLALIPDETKGRMMISKIYIDSSNRRTGLGSAVLDFVKQECINRNMTSIWLTVNRRNTDTILWYKQKGFIICKEEKKAIGNGYYMDDFIMELTLN